MMNESADDFFHELHTENEETIPERKGRHYVESESRFATVQALAELTRTVITLAKAQADGAIAQAETTRTLETLSKSYEAGATDVKTIKVWMEGITDAKGERQLGVLDHIATFKRWKNWVLVLLTGILGVQITNAVIGFLNHTSLSALHTQ